MAAAGLRASRIRTERTTAVGQKYHQRLERHHRAKQRLGPTLATTGRGWRGLLVFGLICALLPGCSLNPIQIFIPLAYASIGTCVALLVSPSVPAAIVGFILGGIIGAAVYNNSLKADLMERQDLRPIFPDNRQRR